MAIIIRVLIQEKHFCLCLLNHRIKYHNYGRPEKNTPPPVKQDRLLNVVCRNALFVQKFQIHCRWLSTWREWLMVVLFNYAWSSNVCESAKNNTWSVTFFSNLIRRHNKLYIKFSGETLKPKFHWLMHYPTFIKKNRSPKASVMHAFWRKT